MKKNPNYLSTTNLYNLIKYIFSRIFAKFTKIMRNFIFFFLLLSCFTYAQQEIISTDRPDQSEGVYTMPKGILQVETGLTSRSKDLVSDTSLRYGVGKTTEIRFSSDIQHYGNTSIENIGISAKQRIYTSNSWLPSITAVGYLNHTPNEDKKWSTDLTMAFEHSISEKFSFDWNIGVNQQFKGFIYTSILNFSPIETLNIFAEYFLNFGNIQANHNLDFGVMYAINPNFQVDIALGQSIFSNDRNPFAVVGFSYRFKKLKKYQNL